MRFEKVLSFKSVQKGVERGILDDDAPIADLFPQRLEDPKAVVVAPAFQDGQDQNIEQSF